MRVSKLYAVGALITRMIANSHQFPRIFVFLTKIFHPLLAILPLSPINYRLQWQLYLNLYLSISLRFLRGVGVDPISADSIGW